jgi:hypothetical protein
MGDAAMSAKCQNQTSRLFLFAMAAIAQNDCARYRAKLTLAGQFAAAEDCITHARLMAWAKKQKDIRTGNV